MSLLNWIIQGIDEGVQTFAKGFPKKFDKLLKKYPTLPFLMPRFNTRSSDGISMVEMFIKTLHNLFGK